MINIIYLVFVSVRRLQVHTKQNKHIGIGSRSTLCKLAITEQSTFVMKYFL